jgi:hypothetical protein
MKTRSFKAWAVVLPRMDNDPFCYSPAHRLKDGFSVAIFRDLKVALQDAGVRNRGMNKVFQVAPVLISFPALAPKAKTK